MRYESLISSLTRFFTFNDGIELESGERLTPVRVAYRTWGRLSPDRDNAVLVCHAFTGSADADEWWQGLIGVGKSLDPRRDFIVCSNVLGSCYGTTGPTDIDQKTGQLWGPGFPAITIRDIVRLQEKLINALGIHRLRLVIGGSLGGMQVLEWAVTAGNRIDASVVVASTGRHSPWCIGFGEAQRAAIRADEKFHAGRYATDDPPADGLAAARMIAMCTYRTPLSFKQRFGREHASGGAFEAESYLRHHGKKLAQRFDANTYITLTEAMDSHDLGRGRGSFPKVLRSISHPVLVVSVDSDQLYLPDEQQELAHHIPFGHHGWINSPHGHDGFLIEASALDNLVGSFRQWPTVRAAQLAS